MRFFPQHFPRPFPLFSLFLSLPPLPVPTTMEKGPAAEIVAFDDVGDVALRHDLLQHRPNDISASVSRHRLCAWSKDGGTICKHPTTIKPRSRARATRPISALGSLKRASKRMSYQTSSHHHLTESERAGNAAVSNWLSCTYEFSYRMPDDCMFRTESSAGGLLGLSEVALVRFPEGVSGGQNVRAGS